MPKYWIVGCGVGILACYLDESEANEMLEIINSFCPSEYMVVKSL